MFIAQANKFKIMVKKMGNKRWAYRTITMRSSIVSIINIIKDGTVL